MVYLSANTHEIVSFGQFRAIADNCSLQLQASLRHKFSVSQSDADVVARYYAYHKSPVARKPGHVVGHGMKGVKVFC